MMVSVVLNRWAGVAEKRQLVRKVWAFCHYGDEAEAPFGILAQEVLRATGLFAQIYDIQRTRVRTEDCSDYLES